MTKEWRIDWEPYEHQKEAFRQSWNKKAFMLRMGVQTGKSAVALLNASRLAFLNHINGLLIVAPSGVHRKWILEEVAKFWPGCVPHKAAWWAYSMRGEDSNNFIDALNTKDFSIISFNIEAFSAASKRAEKIVREWLKDHKVMFVLDESHQIQSPGAARTKTLNRLGKLADFRRTLTGTAGQPIHYFTQYNWLCGGLLGHCFTKFKDHYVEQFALPGKTDRRGRPIIIPATDSQGKIKYKYLHELKEKIAPYTYTIHTEECNDLPPCLYGRIPVVLSGAQKELYSDLKNSLLVEFHGKDISAPQAIQKCTRLRQVLGGYLPDEAGIMWPINVVNPRITALLSKIEILGGQVIVWASYRAEIEAIRDALAAEYGGGQVVTYYGGSDKRTRDADRQKFQEGTVRFLVSNPASGGIGFSLYNANQMIFFSNGYNLKERLQAEGRILAAKQQAHHCLFLDMAAAGTIDEKIIESLLNKFEVESELTGRKLEGWLKCQKEE